MNLRRQRGEKNRESTTTTFVVYVAAWLAAMIAASCITTELAARRPRPIGTADDDGLTVTGVILVGGTPLALGLGLVLASCMDRVTLLRVVLFTVLAVALLSIAPYLLLH